MQKKGARGMSTKTNASRYRIAVIGKGKHCCDDVSNGYNIVPALQRRVALKIVVANRPV